MNKKNANKKITKWTFILSTIVMILCSISAVSSEEEQDLSTLTITISTDKSVYNDSENITIKMIVTNSGMENITLNDAHPAFEVFNDRGESVYSWVDPTSILTVVDWLEIPAGEAIEVLNTTWSKIDDNKNPISSGSYTIRGYLTSTFLESNVATIHLDNRSTISVTPGFELIILFVATGIIMFWNRKRIIGG